MIRYISNEFSPSTCSTRFDSDPPPPRGIEVAGPGRAPNASENGVPWSQPDPVSTDCFVLAPDCVKYLPDKVYAAKCVRETLFHGRAWNTQRADYSAVTNFGLSFGTGCGREGRKDFLGRCGSLLRFSFFLFSPPLPSLIRCSVPSFYESRKRRSRESRNLVPARKK